MREWLKLYKAIHGYGEKLRLYHYAKEIPEGMRLSRDTVGLYHMEIQDLTDRVKRYLDGCGVTLPRTPWNYSQVDRGTWPSHESFRYGHLLPKGQACNEEEHYEDEAA